MPPVPMLLEPGRSRELAADLVRLVDQDRDRAWRARQTRIARNRENWELYWGRQDFSEKRPGQSAEVLPDFAAAIDQAAGEIRRLLTDFSDWFDVGPPGLGPTWLDPATMRALLRHLLQRLYQSGYAPEPARTIGQVVMEGVKLGLLEAVMTFKVYGVDVEQAIAHLEPGRPSLDPRALDAPGPLVLARAVRRTFRLAIDPIPFEDWYPDPSGRQGYVIHEVTRTLAELRANPDYDPAALDRLTALAEAAEVRRDKAARGGEGLGWTDDGEPTVRVRERWGDWRDPRTGTLLVPNAVMTTAGPELLRPPQPNPFWHGRWPFVSVPFVRVPLSTVHQALADRGAPVARAMNELYNLLLDAGLAAVWGTRQIRADWLERPEEIASGIPQGYTAVLNSRAPVGAKVLERVDSGEVPAHGMAMLEATRRAFQTGLATTSFKLGTLPPRQVKATEVVEAGSAADAVATAMAMEAEEGGLVPLLDLAWQTAWQFLDDFTTPELVQILGLQRAALLHGLAPAERFTLLAQGVTFTVSGLRRLASRGRETQQYLGLTQLVATNPALAAAFDAEFDIRKLLRLIIRSLGIDPARLAKAPGEGAVLDPRLVLAAARGGSDLLSALGAGASGGLVPEEPPSLPGAAEARMAAPNPEGVTGPGGGADVAGL